MFHTHQVSRGTKRHFRDTNSRAIKGPQRKNLGNLGQDLVILDRDLVILDQDLVDLG